MEYDDRISTDFERTDHIWLRCKQHLNQRWSTKNISHIGARSLFYELGNITNVSECSCSINSLEVVPFEQVLIDLETGRVKF